MKNFYTTLRLSWARCTGRNKLLSCLRLAAILRLSYLGEHELKTLSPYPLPWKPDWTHSLTPGHVQASESAGFRFIPSDVIHTTSADCKSTWNRGIYCFRLGGFSGESVKLTVYVRMVVMRLLVKLEQSEKHFCKIRLICLLGLYDTKFW